jgi:protoporphyrinogen oxidase
MAACGAAYNLFAQGARFSVFDQGNHPGGHTKTFEYKDQQGRGVWTFDDGPHVSFTKDTRIQEILANNIGGAYHSVPTGVNNYWQGYWIKHPAQCNLFGLPSELVIRCVEDFVGASQEEPPVSNYEEWLISAFGRTFAETFPMEYTKKIHTTEARNLTSDWMGPRVYRPSLTEVLAGAIAPTSPDVHYIESFRYPRKGGFFSYLAPIFAACDLQLDHEVTAIWPESNAIGFRNGRRLEHAGIVSSIPLPRLIPLIHGTPGIVVEAAAALSYTGCVFVNIGIDRPEDSDATWTYFYDQDFATTRLSYPQRFSPEAVPAGCAAFQCEIYFSPKYKPLRASRQELIDSAISDLRRCGMIRPEDTVLLAEVEISPFANVIFDHDRVDALKLVHDYLDEIEIKYCGRFGEWDYLWTDQAFVSGEKASQSLIDSG